MCVDCGEVVVVINIILYYSPCLQIWVKPEGRKQLLRVFHKLSLVNLFNISEECDLRWTMFILQGAPALKKLCIMVISCTNPSLLIFIPPHVEHVNQIVSFRDQFGVFDMIKFRCGIIYVK